MTVLTTLLGGFFTLGTGASVGLCYFETTDCDERAKVIWTTAALLLANCLLLTIVGFFFAPHLSRLMFGSRDADHLIRLSLASLAISTVTMPFMAFLQLEERAKTYVVLTTVSSVITILFSIVGVAYLRRGIVGMFEASLIGAIVLLLATVTTVSPRLKFGLNSNKIAPLVRIGFPSVFGLGAFFFIDWSDRILLDRFLGLNEVGIYSVGYSLGMVMFLAVGAFGSAWPPYFISFINKRDEAAVLFGGILKYYIIAYGTLALVFFLMAKPVVILMTAQPFHSTYKVVGLVALSYMLKGCYLIILPGLVYEKKLYIQSGIEWAAAAVNLGLNFLLIPILRKEGAAIATLIAYLCLPVFTYFLSARYLPVQYEWKGIAKFAAGFVVLAVMSYVPLADTLLSSFAMGLLSLILYALYVLYVTLSSRERAAVSTLLGTVKNRLLYS